MIRRVRATDIPRRIPRIKLPEEYFRLPDEGARRWMIKYARKNYWRVNSLCELRDLIQDGWLCYMVCLRRYPDAKNISHLMRLFQVTYINHIHDLSKHQSRMLSFIDPNAIVDDTEKFMDPRDAEQGDAYIIPNSAPWYVHAFLRLLCSPDGAKQLRRPYRVRLSGVREETHSRLCRLIGADPESTPELPAALETYFASV
jgi:hypothetical protein